ncbi:MAG: spoIIIAE [Clostridiales bacterium]|nr:spoIIIAE [Clostridiales bacterium]
MRIKRIFFMVIVIMLFCQVKTSAATNDWTGLKLNDLENFTTRLQQNVDYMPEISFSKMIDTYKTTHSIGITLKDFSNSFAKFLFKELLVSTRLLIELLLISMLCAVLQNIQNSFDGDNVSKIAYYACFLLMVIVMIKSFGQVVQLGRDTIDNMINFMNALMPTLVVLLATVGGFASAATLDPLIMFTIKIISDIIRDLVLPMTVLVVIINIVDSLSETIKITKLGVLVMQVSKWMLGFAMTVFVGVVTIRSSASTTLDQLTLKTSKFVVDNFIPVVGKALSDAISTVAGYSLLLKDAVSIGGVIIMILICVFPLIKIILMSLVYKLVGAVMEPVVDKRIVDCLSSVGNSLTLVFASVFSVSVMFFVMITIIISTGRLVMMVR